MARGGVMELRTRTVRVKLPNGAIARVEATQVGAEGDVAAIADYLSLDEVITTVEGIAEVLVQTLQKVKPKRASVEFGVEVGFEAGKLIALLVQGSGKANLKITLEWSGGERPTV
jgi:hypothetical protein